MAEGELVVGWLVGGVVLVAFGIPSWLLLLSSSVQAGRHWLTWSSLVGSLLGLRERGQMHGDDRPGERAGDI